MYIFVVNSFECIFIIFFNKSGCWHLCKISDNISKDSNRRV